jgi:predicted nucleic acid-binding protein
MCRLNQQERLQRFIRDLFESGGVMLLHLEAEEVLQVLEIMQRFHLDFDDAYQYVAAEKYDLTLVSFDADFDRTPRGRRTPGEMILEIRR